MLAIMSEDPNLTPHEINLRQTLVSIIETHGRTGKKRGERFYDYPINEKKSIWKEWSKFILPKPVMMKRK
jgi:3-hydroxyacyl-CoA dehydrogenase/enoyl-CoA hydratase/3-hydroxybutyryl-CoA epimerase